MFDSTSVFASELLSFFGKNTAVEIDHRYGTKECAVLSTRTKNVISNVKYEDGLVIVDELFVCPTIDDAAILIMGKKKFPKNRKMNRTWSPIRLTARAEADREITRATLAWSAE
jgi:hypothetical protein